MIKPVLRGTQRAPITLLIAMLALGGCHLVPDDFKVPQINPPQPDAGPEAKAPAELRPPAGNHIVIILGGSGEQVYQCSSTDGSFHWVAKGPQARLYNGNDKLMGKHYPGPTWEYEDGSRVVGEVVAQSPALVPNSVPQLLLRAKSSSDTGMFAHISYVQRLRSAGGVAPLEPCNAAAEGVVRSSLYSAQYVFFRVDD